MTEKTRINRKPDRGVEDREVIYSIIDEGFVCHVAYVTEGRPVVLPTLYARDVDRLLIHGSNSMGVARAVRAGSPLSVAITHIDGLVVARSGFHSSANYRSVVAHGMGRLLEGDEKAAALDIIIDKVIPGRLADVRPSVDAEIGQTSVVELDLDEVSAKMRTGGVGDDPEDLDLDVWAGVIPFRLLPGEPIPDGQLKPGIEVPDYLRPYRR